MQDIIFTVVKLVVMLAATILSAYVIPYIKQRAGSERLEEIAQWTIWAVSWAEQIIVAPGSGEERYREVQKFIKDIAQKKGLPLTDEQIAVLVEAAVRQMHLDEGTIDASLLGDDNDDVQRKEV